ncbi:MAG: FAD binding domain-containing protein [Oscillospiraceae bacterium]|jgi:xanthine dehydrogenase FAD-binding subunit|nr:FAD binding domain-containing protein [Oscillospiraceae bacterium]
MRLNCGYEAPACKAEALRLLAVNSGVRNLRIFAGGTDLLLRVRAGKEKDPTVLDISGLGLDYIEEEADLIRVGAMVTLSRAQKFFADLPEPLRLQSVSSGRVGCWQTRNVATLAGNVCTGLPSADAAVTLLCLEAGIRAESVRGSRLIPIDEFFKGPRRLALEEDEMVTEIVIPKPIAPDGGRFGGDFEKLGRRGELFISVLSVGCLLQLNAAGAVEKARLACGVLAPAPIRLYETEKFLAGKNLTDDLLLKAGEVMRGEIKPRDSYRGSRRYREAAGVNVMKRVVKKSAERAGRA